MMPEGIQRRYEVHVFSVNVGSHFTLQELIRMLRLTESEIAAVTSLAMRMGIDIRSPYIRIGRTQ